jgi:hypothetical protein
MDQGVKRAVLEFPEHVVRLALPGAEYLGTVPTDVAAEPQLVLDTLLRVRYHGVECLVDLEAEATPRPDIGRRCFEYGARASILHQRPVVSVVLWLERGARPPASPYVMQVGDLPPATWPFHGIELYALPAERVLAGDLAELVGLLPLVPFMQGGETLATIEQAARLIQERVGDPEQQMVSEALLAVFAARHLGAEGVLALLRRLFMSTEILDQSPLYRRWIAEGEAEGEAKGRAEGEAKGLREATLAVLRSRWGEVSADLQALVEAASADTLRDMLAHMVTDTEQQLRARLAQ